MPEETQELTREEIREAVEALPGWEWRESKTQGWAIKEGGDEEEDNIYFLVTEDFENPGEWFPSCYVCDAFEMLEVWRLATGGYPRREVQIDLGDRPTVRLFEASEMFERGELWNHQGANVETATVRAILYWARSTQAKRGA